jgi:hypothetical protein
MVMMPLIIVVLVFGVIVVDLYSRTRIVRAKLRVIRKHVPDFKYGGSFMHYYLKGESAGLPVTVSVTPGGNRSRPKIMVTFRTSTPFKLMILRNESQPDFFLRLAHTPVLCSIVKTNDIDFDTRFTIYSYNNSDVPGYFYNTERKNAVSKIFDLGYTLIEFKNKAVSAQKFDYDIEDDLQPGKVSNILEKISVLAHGFK